MSLISLANVGTMQVEPAATPVVEPITWATDIHDFLTFLHETTPEVQMLFTICVTVVMLFALGFFRNRISLESLPVVGPYFKKEEPSTATQAVKPHVDDHPSTTIQSWPEQERRSCPALAGFESSMFEMNQTTQSLLETLATGIDHLGDKFDRMGEKFDRNSDRMDRSLTMLSQCITTIADLGVEIRQIRQEIGHP